jgi:hypothetical protein
MTTALRHALLPTATVASQPRPPAPSNHWSVSFATLQELSDLTIHAGESWISKLTPDDLRELFSLAPGAQD